MEWLKTKMPEEICPQITQIDADLKAKKDCPRITRITLNEEKKENGPRITPVRFSEHTGQAQIMQNGKDEGTLYRGCYVEPERISGREPDKVNKVIYCVATLD